MIRDCLEKKKFVIGKPKNENKQKHKFQARVFSITHLDAHAISYMETGTI